jgi:hypothetical protein
MRLPILLLLTITLLAPGAVRAQETPPDLIVTVRDVHDAGVVGTMVSVRDAADGLEIARATTDVQGQAVFASLRVGEIRVAVEGQLANGTALYLPGQDSAGIRLTLGAPPTRLDLRVEPDGLLRPDPATMIVPQIVGDVGGTVGPLAVYHPEAPIATPPPLLYGGGRLLPAQTAPTGAPGLLSEQGSGPIVETDTGDSMQPSIVDDVPPPWMGTLALILLTLCGVGLFWMLRKERRWRR